MVNPRPLKLRSQIAPAPAGDIAASLPIARVWVDSGVYHLDTPFDYWVPARLDVQAQIGVRVQVEFGKQKHEAIIVNRLESSANEGSLKPVLKIISPVIVATQRSLDLISSVSSRWAGAPFDIVRSAIPPKVASIDSDFAIGVPHGEIPIATPDTCAEFKLPQSLSGTKIRAMWCLPPHVASAFLLAQLAYQRSKFGQVLVVLPDERELLRVHRSLEALGLGDQVRRVDGHLLRSERYRNYLEITQGLRKIALGLRGSIFIPLEPNSTMIVHSEGSEHFYEPRMPSWNVRDVALLRNSQEDISLVFSGYSPCLEVGRLIDSGYLSMISSAQRVAVSAASQIQGELIPSRIFPAIRKDIQLGPVLFLVPAKGYGNAVLCAHCRNIALCDCGGRLLQSASSTPPSCTLCQLNFANWRCKECDGSRIYIASRGIDRFVEELGRSFPNFPIINSAGEHIVSEVDDAPSLVVATPGAEPDTDAGYRAVVIVESLRFLAHSDFRSDERTREQFFSAASKVSTKGHIFIVIDDSHPIVGALARWNPAPMVRRELKQRKELQLPPYSRFIVLEAATKEISMLHTGLLMAQKERRIPENTKISTPRLGASEKSSLSLTCQLGDAEKVVDFIHELQRRRSASHKSLITIRVDPYKLA